MLASVDIHPDVPNACNILRNGEPVVDEILRRGSIEPLELQVLGVECLRLARCQRFSRSY